MQLDGQRRILTNWPHDFPAATQGNRCTTSDLFGINWKELLPGNDTCLFTNLKRPKQTLCNGNRIGYMTHQCLSPTCPPGDRTPKCPSRGFYHCRKINLPHPVLMHQKQPERVFILFQGQLDFAHPIHTFTHHGEITDRINPTAFGAANARTSR